MLDRNSKVNRILVIREDDCVIAYSIACCVKKENATHNRRHFVQLTKAEINATLQQINFFRSSFMI